MKKLIVTCIFVMLSITHHSAIAKTFYDSCIGDNFVQQMPITGINRPTVSIIENVTTIQEGETLSFTANATVDAQGKPFFYWCTTKGNLEKDTSYTGQRYGRVKFTAPSFTGEDDYVMLIVQLGDGLGYVSRKSILLKVQERVDHPWEPGNDFDSETDHHPVVPEPGTFLLFSTGLISMLIIVRRNLKKNE